MREYIIQRGRGRAQLSSQVGGGGQGWQNVNCLPDCALPLGFRVIILSGRVVADTPFFYRNIAVTAPFQKYLVLRFKRTRPRNRLQPFAGTTQRCSKLLTYSYTILPRCCLSYLFCKASNILKTIDNNNKKAHYVSCFILSHFYGAKF